MKWFRWLLTSLAVLLAGGAVFLPTRFSVLVGGGDRVSAVPVVRIQRRAHPRSVRFGGRLYPTNEIDVVSRLAGRVSTIRFKTGDRVTANAIVATVESKSLTQSIATTDAALHAAQDDLVAKNEQLAAVDERLAQTRELYGQDLISRRDFEQASAAAATAEAQVELARARVAQQQAMLAQARTVERYTRVTTPMAGVVIRRWVDLGATIAASTPILTIADVDRLKLTASLSGRDFSDIRQGMAVVITDPNTPGENFIGKVARLTRSSRTETNEIEVEVEVKSDGGLRPGVFVDVAVATSQSKQMLWVPVPALISDAGEKYVYKIAGDRALRQRVSIGQIENNEASVIDGLREGELIIASRPELLKPGKRVRAIVARPNDVR